MLIGVGFFLMAGGVPISSLAMFGFLVSTSEIMGWSWIFAGLFVSFFTVTGHAIGYAIFRQIGPSVWSKLATRYPGLLRTVSRIRLSGIQGAQDMQSTEEVQEAQDAQDAQGAQGTYGAREVRGKSLDLALILLRWVGVGYSQVFWVLGASGHDASGTLRILFLNDIVWAIAWSFGLTKLLIDAPLIGRYLTRFGWVLLFSGLAGYGLKHLLSGKSS
jgi:hypothetical protein